MNTLAMIRFIRAGLSAATVAVLVGCAHPINLEPNQVAVRDDAKLVAKNVGYVITDSDRAKLVTTPGGGGDKVSYTPYRDMEKALRAALRAVYQDVTSVKSASDAAGIKAAGIAYVFTPEISTDSSSSSALTWPPTQFSVVVSCTVTDPDGGVVAKLRAAGQGAAEFSEFKSDFSLSARRAMADVFEKLVAEIRQAPKLQ